MTMFDSRTNVWRHDAGLSIRVAVAGLAVLSALAPSVEAGGMEAGAHTNNSKEKKTDFHVTLDSLGAAITVTSPAAMYTTDGDDVIADEPTIIGNGSTTVQVVWNDLSVQPDETLGWALYWHGHDGVVFEATQWSTGTRGVILTDSPILGVAVFADGQFSLTNGYAQTLEYVNLEYTVQANPLSETTEEQAQLMLDIASGTPFDPPWTPLPDGTIGANDVVLLDKVSISPAEYFISTFRTNFPSDPGDITHVIHMRQVSSVPTVGSWGIIILFVSVLTAGTILVRRRASGGARSHVS